MITALASNQVFVFGSNAAGFHGAGSAGLACRGDARNNWRSDKWFLAAIESVENSTERIGKWAVYGKARGFQEGREGRSYAIQTVIQPGWKRSVSLLCIQGQLVTMFQYATLHPQYEFLMTSVGAGLAGYSNDEMTACFAEAIVSHGPLPSNVTVPPDLYK